VRRLSLASLSPSASSRTVLTFLFPLSLSRRIELSGRGGEWEPSQRRAVKVEAEKRKRLVYKSTDMRP